MRTITTSTGSRASQKNNMNLKFHVPTQQYGFLEIDFSEEEEKTALSMYNKYAESPIQTKGVFEEIKTFTGETVLYDRVSHKYTTLDGKPLMSGSAYKKSLEAPFPETMAAKMGEKYGIPEKDIRAMWKMNSTVSTSFGDALHKAMELYRKYGHHADALKDKEYFLPKNGTIREAVLAFPDESKGHAEIMVSAIEKGMVGQIDWLTVTGEKEGIVEDYKSDMEVKKNLDGHFNQLSFYAEILRHHGWKIETVRVWNWEGKKWASYDSEVLEVKTTSAGR